jgi:hypothetical protein
LFLNFCNYIDRAELQPLIDAIRTPTEKRLNAPRVRWLGWGPDDSQVEMLGEWSF